MLLPLPAAAASASAAQMGGKCPHRKVKKRRLSHKTARRGKFLVKADDAVYDELVKLADAGKDADATQLPVDEDLPGMGQFYCLHCDRYFASESVKEEHYRSKR
ncbi:hypothetical protein L9G15_21570, partial [Shewanella sp. A3A]|nr:hypothetical protein [Shewanella ferrihydritica]